MRTAGHSLTDIIIEKIRLQGPLSFRDFMEMSLYYPELGYYTSARERIGENGDYYTSPWLSSVFGEMLARQLEEMWTIMDKKDFTIVEFGGGNGSLSHAILQQLKKNPSIYEGIRYHIIEKKDHLPDEDRKQAAEKVSWHDSIRQVPLVEHGCIFSNELVDNFSISRVVMLKELMEVFVDYKDGFVEQLRPASNSLKDYFEQLKVCLPEGYCTEINLQAIDWMKDIAGVLRKGFVLTIDYGYPSSLLYSADRRNGTLVCYHRHTVNFCPYINIGQQDITTHVNFSALRHWGIINGLDYGGYTSQAAFLQGLGLTQHIKEKETGLYTDGNTAASRTMLLHHFMAGMGRKFKVLIQQKGLKQTHLSGLQFCLPGL